MKTLTIDKEKLVDALMRLNEAGASDTLPYMVAFNPEDEAPKARVIWADTPSSMGGYCANFVGDENFMPDAFLRDREINSYSWGVEEDEEEDADMVEMAARDWIEENLVEVLDTEFGVFQVAYE